MGKAGEMILESVPVHETGAKRVQVQGDPSHVL